jgi:hypothetical protein
VSGSALLFFVSGQNDFEPDANVEPDAIDEASDD